MICFDISLFIVAAFLVLTLVVGIYFSRKETTFREYAVGKKKFSTATLVATVLATLFTGGGMMRNVEQVYDQGLYWIVPGLFVNRISIWILSRLVVRMGPFMHHLSMAETIGSIYGTLPRIVTALFGICSSIIMITAQVVVTSRTISICMDGDNTHLITILATLILIFYSTFGGIRAVVFTDVFQLVSFTIIIPILAWFIFQVVDKPIVDIIAFIQSQPKFQFSNVFQLNVKAVSMFALYLSILVPFNVPATVQRVYMSYDPIQARRVFTYVTLFSFLLAFIIVLIGLFVFVGIPYMPVETVWSYIMHHIPLPFKGFVAISLLAMSMSTADSHLNACSVMVNHDILGCLRKTSVHQMWLVRLITFFSGLLTMIVAFYYKSLWQLFVLYLELSIPVITAPFILAVFGFRGTSRTALVGMATGVLSILAWNKWIKPTTGIDGSFVSMLANGLAMMAVHYLLKQPESAGWVGLDYQFKQIQQENARKRAERKETIKNAWANRKTILAKLVPSHAMMVYVGCYLSITGLLYWFIIRFINHRYWLTFHFLGSACFLCYPFLYDISKKIRIIPAWFIGLGWLMGLAIYLPLSVLWNWFHFVDPIFITFLNLAHCTVILWVLPLYLAIGAVAVTSLVAIYPIAIGLPFPVLSSLFPLFLLGLLLFTVIICFKVKVGDLTARVLYFEN